MKNKIILIHPRIFDYKYESIPLALLMLAATLEKAGFRPIVIDQATEQNYKAFILEHIEESIYVGISALSGNQIHFGLEISEYVKAISPATPVVWGGRHPSALPEQTAEDQRVDIVVNGEGDFVAVEIAVSLRDSKPLEKIKGITFKKDGILKTTPKPEIIRDLNTLPKIPWHFFDFDKYFSGRKNKRLAVQTGRGCPYSCTFCSHKIDEQETFREFSAKYILNNIEDVVRKYSIDAVDLYEPFFVSNNKRVGEFCQGLLERSLNISWTASARANNFWRLPTELLKMIKESGCHYLTFGFESGSQPILNKINKRIKVDDILKSVEVCRQHGIVPEACFIVGFPSESMQDVLATLKVIAEIRKICPKSIFHVQIYTAFPGSILYKECLEYFELKMLDSLDRWGDFMRWRRYRPWLKKIPQYFLQLLNASIYASSLDYLLNKRPELRFARPAHFMVSSAYSVYLTIFNQFIKTI